MQHIYRLLEPDDIEDPVLDRRVDPDLNRARPDARHRFPVGRGKPLLDLVQFVTGLPASVLREGPQICQRGANP